MEFTCVAPKDSGDYGSSMSSVEEKVTEWTCRKLHMPIYATVNELRYAVTVAVLGDVNVICVFTCRHEMDVPDLQGEEGTNSLLSANITDGSVVEITE